MDNQPNSAPLDSAWPDALDCPTSGGHTRSDSPGRGLLGGSYCTPAASGALSDRDRRCPWHPRGSGRQHNVQVGAVQPVRLERDLAHHEPGALAGCCDRAQLADGTLNSCCSRCTAAALRPAWRGPSRRQPAPDRSLLGTLLTLLHQTGDRQVEHCLPAVHVLNNHRASYPRIRISWTAAGGM